MLYLCATPIGNLGDITERVLDTLREVDLIAAEDTRNSLKLLTHFDIHTPMTSYHEYNKVEKARELIDKMHGGLDIALLHIKLRNHGGFFRQPLLRHGDHSAHKTLLHKHSFDRNSVPYL